jgi:uncharacterized protein
MTTFIPFRQFILKVHSRCNIACDYCYVYEHEDQSWRDRPLAMSPQTVRQTALRIAEHARTHQLAAVHVILHGGEPLLFGVERTREALETLRSTIRPVTGLDLRIHTNAIRLDEKFCDLFNEYDVKVGVSLDGDQTANDRHRRFADGRGSHAPVRRALSLLRRPEYHDLYAGLLCTIDVANDPIAVYEALAAEEPPRIDLLLPHSTWEHPPPRPKGSDTEYADWLGAIYDRWTADGRPFEIRTFQSIIGALHGLPSRTESLGLTPSDLVVVETDGALEQLDSLKTAFPGAPATGFDVFHASFDQAAGHAGIEARQQGLAGLCETCRACPVVGVCGGGLYPHRYSSENGFRNPSVYCPDLKAVIVGIQRSEQAAAARGTQVGSGAPAGHALPEPMFAALAAGYGAGAAVRALADAQVSLRRALLAAILGELKRSGTHADAAALLPDLDTSAPEALHRILAHPYTRVWAVRCLESLRRSPHPRRPADSANELDHVNALALAAAHHAGIDAGFDLPVRDGAVHVPTLGAALLPGQRTVRARTENGTLTFGAGPQALRVTPGAPGPQPEAWQSVRILTAPGYSVHLEDTDPYRDCHGWRADRRLPQARAQAWQESFTGAVALIGGELPAYEEGLRTGLTSLMPIEPQGGTGDVSAAARHAFGAIGAALPATPEALALLLVHEFQHVKLGAVLDLFDLFDKSDTAPRHYAPWRPDPRPLEGLLQGTYAHIGVTDYWRVRRHGAADGDAEVQFARWRTHTAEATDVLLKSGSLTPLGTRFVEAMRQTVTPWFDEPVTAAALESAQAVSTAHREAYEALMAAL